MSENGAKLKNGQMCIHDDHNDWSNMKRKEVNEVTLDNQQVTIC
jgi:hypothetical protein